MGGCRCFLPSSWQRTDSMEQSQLACPLLMLCYSVSLGTRRNVKQPSGSPEDVIVCFSMTHANISRGRLDINLFDYVSITCYVIYRPLGMANTGLLAVCLSKQYTCCFSPLFSGTSSASLVGVAVNSVAMAAGFTTSQSERGMGVLRPTRGRQMPTSHLPICQ